MTVNALEKNALSHLSVTRWFADLAMHFWLLSGNGNDC